MVIKLEIMASITDCEELICRNSIKVLCFFTFTTMSNSISR